MALVDDTQRSALLARAQEAISAPDSGVSHEIYRDIVQTLTRLCNKNQKEIAAELQILAKTLEDEGKATEAFEFKQRTCAVMLELSMEERRRNRVHGQTGAPSLTSFAPSAPTARPIIGAARGEASSSPPGQTPDTSGAPGNRNHDFSPAGVQTQHALSVEETIPPNPTGKTISTESGAGTSAALSTAVPQGSTASDTVTVMQASATAIDTVVPFLSIDYLYMGSSDYDRDLAYYRDVLGAQEVWNFDRFGSRITAFSLCAGPLILIADHRSAPACQPVFRVADLSVTARDLKQRGWQPASGPFGTPNGEAYSFKDPSGNRFAIYQIDETSTDRAYFDPTDTE
jgi:catechol 2,3-dioxygenase-like lactoylglutathione lyase family enzyme